MLEYIQGLAVKNGYSKLLVETYESEEFSLAQRFYEQQGFSPAGRIERYIDDSIAMLVYAKRI